MSVVEEMLQKLSGCCGQADWWHIVVPLLTEYRQLLTLVFSLAGSFAVSSTQNGTGNCCCMCLKLLLSHLSPL